MLIALMSALIIVLGMRMMGALLISSLIVLSCPDVNASLQKIQDCDHQLGCYIRHMPVDRHRDFL